MTYSGGGAENLEEAIVVWRAALELQPPKDSCSDSLHNLAQLLVLLSEKDGKPENLNEAIVHLWEMIELCSPDHPCQPSTLFNLMSYL